MIFKGYGKRFSIIGMEQYTTIGDFWDYMSDIFGMENIIGLGYNWTDDSIEYLIGLKNGEIQGKLIEGYEYSEVEIPDNGWQIHHGKTKDLQSAYAEIYKSGSLKYELETFTDEGNFEIYTYR